MREFFDTQDQDASRIEQWDAFKAYLQGILIREMNKVKHESSTLRMEVETRVQAMEQEYVASPSDLTKEAWQDLPINTCFPPQPRRRGFSQNRHSLRRVRKLVTF